VNNGLVLAFTDNGTNGTAWVAFPYMIPATNNSVVMNYGYNPGRLLLTLIAETGSGYGSLFAGWRIKVILIPPASLASVSAVDLSDYEQVLSAF